MSLMNRLSRAVASAFLAASLIAGCASTVPAPVIDRAAPDVMPGEMQAGGVRSVPLPTAIGPEMYVVKKGDTLRAIALDHGQSYRDLAAWNSLTDPNRIEVGQVLRTAPPGAAVGNADAVAVAKPVNMAGAGEPLAALGERSLPVAAAPPIDNDQMLKRTPKGGKLPYTPDALEKLQKLELPAPSASLIPSAIAPAAPLVAAAAATAAVAKPEAAAKPAADGVDWGWPSTGKLLGTFVEDKNKGIDIAGKAGEPVVAAAAGKVILVSSALRGYGNFVIIKHNAMFLSVYAHNSRILVKEEQTVSKGQKIAEIGSSDADQPKLHFEIRRQGKPVDPLKLLPAL